MEKTKKDIREKRFARWYRPYSNREKDTDEIEKTLNGLIDDAKKEFPEGYEIVYFTAGLFGDDNAIGMKVVGR